MMEAHLAATLGLGPARARSAVLLAGADVTEVHAALLYLGTSEARRYAPQFLLEILWFRVSAPKGFCELFEHYSLLQVRECVRSLRTSMQVDPTLDLWRALVPSFGGPLSQKMLDLDADLDLYAAVVIGFFFQPSSPDYLRHRLEDGAGPDTIALAAEMAYRSSGAGIAQASLDLGDPAVDAAMHDRLGRLLATFSALTGAERAVLPSNVENDFRHVHEVLTQRLALRRSVPSAAILAAP